MRTLIFTLLLCTVPTFAEAAKIDTQRKALDKCYANLEKRLEEARAMSVLTAQMVNAVEVGKAECAYYVGIFESQHGKGSYTVPKVAGGK